MLHNIHFFIKCILPLFQGPGYPQNTAVANLMKKSAPEHYILVPPMVCYIFFFLGGDFSDHFRFLFLLYHVKLLKTGSIYLNGIRNVTAFVGTCELFYPDVTKFFGMLDEDPSNELRIGEEMNHVYLLFPIKEAKPAFEKIIQVAKR